MMDVQNGSLRVTEDYEVRVTYLVVSVTVDIGLRSS
jgi:hypothetical protein